MAHDPTDDFVAIAYVIIVITAAAALVGADKGEGSLDHVKPRAVTLISPVSALWTVQAEVALGAYYLGQGQMPDAAILIGAPSGSYVRVMKDRLACFSRPTPLKTNFSPWVIRALPYLRFARVA